MEDYRPDPDSLLAAIQKQDAQHNRGKLKIFLGMSAGVGKTYAMLESAHRFKAEGGDVVVGYVETHKRPDTTALLDGLEIIPPLLIEYRGSSLRELDTDAIIRRKPQLVLVDELAHTNAQGCRHTKRYQDVIELLDAGLDVWTTVNVQHFESRADAVRQITGITVHETIPDSLLDTANEIELIDLSPQDLRKRLSEGKVYTAERVEVASNNFFRVGNLTALREMALRLTAEHVDHKLQDYMQIKRIAGPWKSGERLMVAVGPSPFSERLIRWTRRIAYNLEAEWLVVYIETSQPLSIEEKKRLARNITLARSLGGEIVTATGDNIAETLLRVARQRNVSQIVLGKPQHSRWQLLLRGGSLVDKIIRSSGEIDIMVVTGDDSSDAPPITFYSNPETRSKIKQYLWALLFIAIVILVDLGIFNLLVVGYQAIGLIDLFAVLVIAAYLGRGPALLAASISALSWNFLFIDPRFTLIINQAQDVILVLLYFAIALFTGNLTSRIRRQERQARYHTERTQALYTLAHQTATAINMDDVLKTAVDQISSVFDAEVAILIAKGDELEHEPHESSSLVIDEKEYSVALWVYEHKKPAGRFTETLALVTKGQYIPLLTPTRIVGVIGIRTRQNERLSFDQEGLLETFISQIALVIERELLDESAEQSAMLRESERLYTTLLNSISHELRTPIATIKGASSSLLNHTTNDNIQNRTQLIHDIEDSADRLNRLVENLLDMSRLESGRLSLKWDWCDLTDIIGVALKQLGEYQTRNIQLDLPADLPLIYVDFGLMVQILVNLLDNACRYTPPDKPIRITASKYQKQLHVSVIDKGTGIPPELLERVFDKFYRLPGTTTGGTGLGLSISRGLAEAHKATIKAENMPEGGAKFTLILSLLQSPPPVQEAKYD
ncbi:MAG: sensor histidine kinase KdpD [bacterium]|nr:sensor histidine kinase KdpD [bacterium]